MVVVGGGPAGATAARVAAERGARVLLVERTRKSAGRCAGVVSPRARELLAVPEELVLARIKRAIVYSPGGKTLELSASRVKACVIDRAGLDELLLERAREAGAEVWRGVAAVGLSGETLLTTSGEVSYSVLVGADGPVSFVAHWAGLPRPRELLVGVQATLRAEFPGDTVEVFLGREVAPGFFAWAVPAGGVVRVGLATTAWKAAPDLLEKLVAKRFPRAEVVNWVGGLIPIGPPERTAAGRVLLAGDAAGQVKPLSGGGLYFGIVGARLAGEAAAEGPAAIPRYEERWRRELGGEIAFGLKARQLLFKLSDQELDRALEALSDRRLLEFLAERADIDYPSRLVDEVRSAPAIWWKLLASARAFGWSRIKELLS